MSKYKELDLVESKKLREKFISKVEVLDKVKQLILLPNTNFATQEQVAEYYEVPNKTIDTIINRHKNELESDGFKTFKKSEVLKMLNLQSEGLENTIGKSIATLKDGSKIEIPNRGLRLFPRRAILRIGMLLRDSEVAKEIRTYLLNIEENSTECQKTNEIERLNREDQIVLKIINAKNKMEMAIAVNEYKTFKDKEIKKRDIKIDALVDGIVKWDKRNAINKIMRRMAFKVFQGSDNPYALAYNKLKDEMLYKHKVHINKRLKNLNKKSSTMFDVLNEEEMSLAIQSCIALCEMYNINIDDILYK